MSDFAAWLASTSLSSTIAENLWVIPLVQSIHIVAIAIAFVSLFVIVLRIWGWAGRDISLTATARRFAPWLWAALAVLAVTGVLMVIGEPARELVSFSFWAKMILLAIGIAAVGGFQIHLAHRGGAGEEALTALPATKALAGLTLLVWIGVIFMGRLIAWDALIWGPLSPQYMP
jgi:uncharacterized membrane protein